MDFTIDLDDFTCSGNPLEALEYLLGREVVFSISRDSPLLPIIRSKYKIKEISREGDIIYFMISSDGSGSMTG
ncbi:MULTISPECIES: hypothetical protein [Metallosphaera]|uniref:hypothetical protein n=1 Tax=Metallosphaera TaxID=41980 RepID=UPI001F052559|nr:hypothetical protein [Metallosphaera sedula]MCH1771623.1 hypothetical protein [Metallosphaera sedula]MCP6728222.1 hypothetical protein [Metallosphaera sedula]BBL46635.1 hypothetical protein MJ1HA_0734 [Metallosphaera sedula]